MNLRFLGQTYSQSQQQILTISSKILTISSQYTACYRGQKYNLRIPVVNIPTQSSESQMSAVIYKYRGISYVVERPQFPTKLNKTLIRH